MASKLAYCLPFLAKEALIRLEKEEKKKTGITHEYERIIDLDNISDKQIKLFKTKKSKCNKCEFLLSECDTRIEEIKKYHKLGNDKLNEIWAHKPDYRSCIASYLLEQIERGQI